MSASIEKKRIINANVKQDLLMRSLTDYFNTNKKNLNKMIKIIEGKSNISLRIIDWFITNYSKNENIYIKTGRKTKAGDIIMFNVHHNYKTQLKSFSKKQFDPFRRNMRIDFEYQPNKTIETTVAQLNFFRWSFKNRIIEYIEKHYKTIEKDMLESLKNKKKKGDKLHISASCKMNKKSRTVIVDFF
jgi:hypothetical protein